MIINSYVCERKFEIDSLKFFKKGTIICLKKIFENIFLINSLWLAVSKSTNQIWSNLIFF